MGWLARVHGVMILLTYLPGEFWQNAGPFLAEKVKSGFLAGFFGVLLRSGVRQGDFMVTSLCDVGEREAVPRAGGPLWLTPSLPLRGVEQHETALCAWWHPAQTGTRRASRGAVLLCPPLGYELWTSYQTRRALALQLAEQGFDVLRFDLTGTGDSAGDELEPARLEQWRADIALAVARLRELSSSTYLILLGLRLGGALVCEQAVTLRAQAVVLWDPVVSGRRYVRELKMLATKEDSETTDDILEVAGCLYSAETLQALSAIELLKLPDQNWAGSHVLLLDRDDRPANEALAQQLTQRGAQVTHRAVTGMNLMMDVSTEDAQIPQAILDDMRTWLCALPATGDAAAPATSVKSVIDSEHIARTRMSAHGQVICEQLLQVGTLPLFGVLGTPAEATAGTAKQLVMLLSSGTEHRIGPGRAWVSLSRLLNARGVATLRADLNGIGDSPMRGAPRRVRPYDPSFSDDVAEFIRDARARGFSHITLLGLCSGAWMAVQAGVQMDVNAVIAINPQLYWQQGDPVESLIQDTRIRRRDEVLQEQEGGRTGLWTQQDEAGVRTPAGEWLDTLVKRNVRTLLAFADNDDGLQHLRVRCGRRFEQVLASQVVSMIEVPGLDHPMHRHRRRPVMFDAITQFVMACQ